MNGMHRVVVTCACALFACIQLQAQVTPVDTISKKAAPAPAAQAAHTPSKWYEKLSVRGYAQFRYNRLLESNPDLKCEQCDKSIGKGQEFSFRRARLVFSGDVHPRLYTYIQFDYSADASSTSKHFLQVRDAYFDYAFNKTKTIRFRFGQSKVPYGFENMQSSSNRLPFDRADALNSAAPNERDFGGFLYYAPEKIRARFKMLTEEGLKGSGDFGVLGFGLYNGQTANKPELNDNLHAVARLSYPLKVGRQIIEPGIQAYSGQFTLPKDQLSAGVKYNTDRTYLDHRVAASMVLYAQPFGIEAEYNWGESPTFDPATDSIRVQSLKGGYILASYRTKIKGTNVQPYVRYQTFDGAKKQELDARIYHVKETEIGVEWQINKNLELTLAYMISQRKYQDFVTDYDESGHLLRIQLQANY